MISGLALANSLRYGRNAMSVFTRTLGAALVLALACGGPSWSYQGNRFTGPTTAYHFAAPEGWQRVDSQGDLAWMHPATHAIVEVDASCDPALDLPLEALARQLVIGFTEVETLSAERFMLDEREALQLQLRAKLDGVPQELSIVVLKKNGCQYDFVLAGPAGSLGTVGEAFNASVRSFHKIETL